MTLRQLLWMADGHGRQAWAHTAVLCALLANCHRDPRKGKPFTPEQFNPYAEKRTGSQSITVTKENLDLLRQAFVGLGRSKPRTKGFTHEMEVSDSADRNADVAIDARRLHE